MELVTTEGNEYLALRDAKIKRNNEKLQKLGLATNRMKSSKKSGGGLMKNSARSDDNNDDDGATHVIEKKLVSSTPRRTLRRSTRRKPITLSDEMRVESESDVAQRVNNNAVEISSGSISPKKQIKKRQRPNDRGESNIKKTAIQIIRSEAKPGTTRATKIDVKRVLYGDFNYPIFIGHQLSSPGKAAVVEHANLICRNEFGLSFNKYSGVCEWSNEAIFLWVNINAPNADVKNEFFLLNADDKSNTIMQMSWFGGSRMKEDSAVIQNLITIGQKAAMKDDGIDNNDMTLADDCGIVLWCRLYDDQKKSFGPYVCLGRLSYHIHDPQVHPIKFIWNLEDYAFIKGNETAYQTFQKFANA